MKTKMDSGTAEDFAQPSYKWLGERYFIENLQGWRISIFPGGIGFSLYNYSDQKALRVTLHVKREDGVEEHYLSEAYYCGEWGGPYQKWQTHLLPLFPYESLHGRASYMTFSYAVLKDGKVLPSEYRYRFAALDDFHCGHMSPDDYHDSWLKAKNHEPRPPLDDEEPQDAYERLNASGNLRHIVPFFTRGEVNRPGHPMHAIHMAIDRVIEQKVEDPVGTHTIRLAMFDFDDGDMAAHLAYAKGKGVDVECVGDWTRVSTLNASENVAVLRRASIPVYGMVRNDPNRLDQDMASMHTKIILFDNQVVHSASYNLHFHLWGGNWENSVSERGRDAFLLYESVYNAIRYGSRPRLTIDPAHRYNLYYSFGTYEGPSGPIRAQDALVAEIVNARHSIAVCMFELARLKGVVSGSSTEWI